MIPYLQYVSAGGNNVFEYLAQIKQTELVFYVT